jgi:uncharacterized protein YigA (DUF484 family)
LGLAFLRLPTKIIFNNLVALNLHRQRKQHKHHKRKRKNLFHKNIKQNEQIAKVDPKLTESLSNKISHWILVNFAQPS